MTTINPQAVRGPVTAVPVVAGTGIRFVEDAQNNRVLAEIDETVLWEDDTGIAATGESAQLSESIANFSRVAVYSQPIYGGPEIRNEFQVMDSTYRFGTFSQDGSNVFIAAYNMTISNKTISILRGRRVTIASGGTITTTDLSATGSYKAPIRKVVGINRIASN